MSPVLSLAPLHGVTNRVFRSAWFSRFAGFDETVAPFALAVTTDRAKSGHFKDFVPDPSVRVPVIPQLLGTEAKGFLDSARVLADMGHREVNWNLGCPYPMVAKKGRGSGLLPHPDKIDRFLDAVMPNLGLGLSVKLRLGRESPSEILALMPVLNRYPLARVVIHPRLGVQMYRGSVDLVGFERALEACAHRVGYNGDIESPRDFARLSSRFPTVKEWMIGRAAVRDPFLPARIKGLPLPADEKAALRAFHDGLFSAYREVLCGPAHALDKMKEIWSYLGFSFPDGKRELDSISRAKTLDAYSAAVDALFSRKTAILYTGNRDPLAEREASDEHSRHIRKPS